jgi:hypothetical protein
MEIDPIGVRALASYVLRTASAIDSTASDVARGGLQGDLGDGITQRVSDLASDIQMETNAVERADPLLGSEVSRSIMQPMGQARDAAERHDAAGTLHQLAQAKDGVATLAGWMVQDDRLPTDTQHNLRDIAHQLPE